mmetsp:Transcript_3717/g.8315  ORF Transcript_3717/g.8315 Transcript_3717/m.8315 type:complete len:84 (+) Transcript_3717:435-686(+)
MGCASGPVCTDKKNADNDHDNTTSQPPPVVTPPFIRSGQDNRLTTVIATMQTLSILPLSFLMAPKVVYPWSVPSQKERSRCLI